MSAYGAPAMWFPTVPDAAGMVRLTRRGRLLRALALGLLLVASVAASLQALDRGAAMADEAPGAAVATSEVEVAQGDSLWEIAVRIAPEADPRDVVVAIQELNGLRSNMIQPGQVLLVPTSW